MKTRTFQEIYDFCRTDDTYRSYFEASDESRITGARARKYYYGDIRRGQCRVGTFIYRQSMRLFLWIPTEKKCQASTGSGKESV